MWTSPNWPAPARLLLVPVAALGVGLDGFAIGDLGLLGLDFGLVAALEALAEQLQVQFAHAVGHHFLGLRIGVQAEGGDLPIRLCAGAVAILASSPRPFEEIARPTMGAGRWMCGSAGRPATCRS